MEQLAVEVADVVVLAEAVDVFDHRLARGGEALLSTDLIAADRRKTDNSKPQAGQNQNRARMQIDPVADFTVDRPQFVQELHIASPHTHTISKFIL